MIQSSEIKRREVLVVGLKGRLDAEASKSFYNNLARDWTFSTRHRPDSMRHRLWLLPNQTFRS
jgi:hypothetical protein